MTAALSLCASMLFAASTTQLADAGGAPAGLGVRNHAFRVITQQAEEEPGTEFDTAVNSDIAMDPNDHSRMVAVAQTGEFPDGGAAWEDYAITLDNGKTWTGGHIPEVTLASGGDYPRVDEPRITIGPDGTAYVVSRVYDPATCASALSVSTLAVRTGWRTTDLFAQSGCDAMVGRPSVAVGPDLVYAAWEDGTGAIQVSSSPRGGGSWSSPVVATPPGSVAVAPVLLLEPSGRLVLSYSEANLRLEIVQGSDDEGATFDPPVIVHDFDAVDPTGILAGNDLGIGDAAVDPVTGRLYVAWPDVRYDPNGTNAVMMSLSSDEGRTWLGPKRLSGLQPPQAAVDRFTVSIAAYDGFVTATWYHLWVGDPLHRNKLNRGFTYSNDGGVTWSRQLMIGCRKHSLDIDMNYAAQVNGLVYLGDASGLVADDVDAHPAWAVATAGDSPQNQVIWSAAMTYVVGPGPGNGPTGIC